MENRYDPICVSEPDASLLQKNEQLRAEIAALKERVAELEKRNAVLEPETRAFAQEVGMLQRELAEARATRDAAQVALKEAREVIVFLAGWGDPGFGCWWRLTEPHARVIRAAIDAARKDAASNE